MQRPWLRLSLLSLVLAACSTSLSTNLELSNYDTSCKAEADCTIAFVGDPCTSSCLCPNAALNIDDYPREQTDLAAVTALCESKPATCTTACTTPKAACVNGACIFPGK